MSVTNQLFESNIVAVIELPNGCTGFINDSYFKGKTRRQCIEEVNKIGKFKFIFTGDENTLDKVFESKPLTESHREKIEIYNKTLAEGIQVMNNSREPKMAP